MTAPASTIAHLRSLGPANAAPSEPDDGLDAFGPADEDAPPIECDDERPASSAPVARSRVARTIRDVIESWRREGPLQVVPTGIAPLDDALRGGFVVGRTFGVLGAPDAAKTAWIASQARRFSALGFVVAMHAVDEDDEDLVPRFGQMEGHDRADMESRRAEVLDALARDIGDLPIRFFDDAWSVEEVFADVAAWRDESGATGAVYIGDSLQTIRSERASEVETERAIVTANIRSIKAQCRTRGILGLFTSEMNRGAYRNEEASQTANDMASGKESGAIEYTAKALISLRGVKDRPDLVELRVVKNKRGPSYPRLAPIRLHFSRNSHRFTVDDSPVPMPADREAERQADTRRQVSADATILASVIAANQGIGERQLRAELKRRGHGWGVPRLEAAKRELGARLEDRGEHARDVRWHIKGGSDADV